MTPLQSIAMGLVVVLVHAPFGGYDAVADPAGWLLVLLGLIRLRPRLAGAGGLVGVALLSLAVATATYPPQVREQLTDSGGWALSLPQLAFGYLLCTRLAPHRVVQRVHRPASAPACRSGTLESVQPEKPQVGR